MADINNLKQAYSMMRMALGQKGLKLRMNKADVLSRCSYYIDTLIDGSTQVSKKTTRKYNHYFLECMKYVLNERAKRFREEHGFNIYSVDDEMICREAELYTKRWIVLKSILDMIDIDQKVYLSLSGTDITTFQKAAKNPIDFLTFVGLHNG